MAHVKTTEDYHIPNQYWQTEEKMDTTNISYTRLDDDNHDGEETKTSADSAN